ncbi:MAG: hypothetical protein NVSMB14_02550 [Isosphaeraceae bacterium]
MKPVKIKDSTPYLEELRAATIPRILEYAATLEVFKESALAGASVLKVLAIDPGITNVAVCYLDLEYDTTHTSKIEIPPGIENQGAQFPYLKAVIEHWVWMFRPQVIFIESVAYGMEYGVMNSGRFQQIVEDIAFERGVPCYVVANATMRSYFECKGGQATKSEMKLKVFQKYGKEFPTEDETDAFAIAQTGIAMIDGTYEQFKEANKAKAKARKKKAS